MLSTALDGYPTVSKLCQIGQHNQLAISSVPGLKLDVPASCALSDVTITLTVYYADPPYNTGIPIQQHDDDLILIQLSPIIRLEPDGYQFTPDSNSQVTLQLPIYYFNQLAPCFAKDQNLDFQIQIYCQKNDESEDWQLQDLQHQCDHDQSGFYCIRFAINHFSKYGAFSSIRKTFASFNKLFSQPLYQQEINVFAYLSAVDPSNDNVHLKIILARRDKNEAEVKEKFPKEYTKTRLVVTGYQDKIIQNGKYEATLKEEALACRQDNCEEAYIDWNKRFFHAFNYLCKYLNKEAMDIARIHLQPLDLKKKQQC